MFAAVGAWLSAAFMPALLDYIFVTVQRSILPQEDAFIAAGAGQKQEPRDTRPKPPEGGDAPTENGQPPNPAEGGQDGSEQPSSEEVDDSGTSNGTQTSPVERDADPTASAEPEPTSYPGSSNPVVIAAMALLGAIVGGGIGNIAINYSQRFAKKWDMLEIGDKVSMFLGVFAGIVASIPFLLVFQGLGGVIAPLLTFALILGFSTVSIMALRSMSDILPWHKSKALGRRTGKKILDTNVIIDGRILDVARSGFLQGEIYVPKFVIDELQHIADSADSLRRQRGRRGLEVLRLLQSDYGLQVGTDDDKVPPVGEVDDRLVKLALALGGDLVSNDYNLNKVAGLQKVRVLNINDLALSLRPNVLPGETLVVTVIREGNQPGQGVGYLEDGTMVVIEQGRTHIGSTVEVTVTQVIQTERGKMIFGDKPVPGNGGNGKNGR